MVSKGPLTIVELLLRAEEFLRECGCDTPRLDAQVLLADVLGCDRINLYVDHAKPLTEEERSKFRTFVRRRANHEPVAYIIGKKEFWSMEFAVDPRVLIPRPDTETVVEEALDRCSGMTGLELVDVGTGSGCLCAALTKELEGSMAVAVDLKNDTLELARANLKNLGLEDRVSFVRGSLMDALSESTFDLVCANLPYVPSAKIADLPDDVRLFEPLFALDGGRDGLELIRTLVRCVPDRLKKGGVLVLEVGQGQAGQVRELCLEAGLQSANIRHDLAGIDRVVSAIRV